MLFCRFNILTITLLYYFCELKYYYLYQRNSVTSILFRIITSSPYTYSVLLSALKIEQSNWRRLMITIKQELKAMVDLICLFSFLEIDWIMIPPALEMTIYKYIYVYTRTLITLNAKIYFQSYFRLLSDRL